MMWGGLNNYLNHVEPVSLKFSSKQNSALRSFLFRSDHPLWHSELQGDNLELKLLSSPKPAECCLIRVFTGCFSFVGFCSRQELGKRLGKDMKAVKACDATQGTADLTMSEAVELCFAKTVTAEYSRIRSIFSFHSFHSISSLPVPNVPNATDGNGNLDYQTESAVGYSWFGFGLRRHRTH